MPAGAAQAHRALPAAASSPPEEHVADTAVPVTKSCSAGGRLSTSPARSGSESVNPDRLADGRIATDLIWLNRHGEDADAAFRGGNPDPRGSAHGSASAIHTGSERGMTRHRLRPEP